MDHKFKSKWESNSLTYDKDYGYDGISWRQRNFMCNFCKKEYKSAQALGGHMNVHRRDRARLRLSSPPLDYPPSPNPNPIPSPNLNPSNFASPPSSLLCLPYKTFHASLFPLASPSSTMKSEEKQEMLQFVPNTARNFLGEMTKKINMEGSFANINGGYYGNSIDQENESRVWKKRESVRLELDMGLLKDGKFDMELDLELRLGRS
nr:transcriptional regulator SUPERMAN-like [Tanacetum cinerariifolium]